MLNTSRPANDDTSPVLVFLGLGMLAWIVFSTVARFVFLLWVITALTPLASVTIPAFWAWAGAIILSLPRLPRRG